MRMKTLRWGIIGIAILGFSLAVFSQTADDMFQRALRLEKSEGKLAEAIELYQKVLAGPSSKALAAQAQLRIGMCYEMMGIAKAAKAYELVIENYADQTEVVAEARSRLAALRKTEPAGLSMSRLLPPEVYLECQTLSPDGTKVAGIDFQKGQNVAVYDLASEKLKYITNYDWEKEGLWTYFPAWSPDGREIVFQAGTWYETSIAGQLWLSNLGGESRKLFENPHGYVIPFDWLPDGSAIAVVLRNENKTASLGLVSAKEGGLREICPLLADAAANGGADASPDGRFIVFADGPSNSGKDIYVIPAEGGPKTAITDHPADDKQPRWSPDGRHIVFLSDRHGSKALWGMAVRDGRPYGQPFWILEGMQDSDLGNWTKRGLLANTIFAIHDIYTLEIDPQSHAPLGKPEIVNFTPSGSNYMPLWSPDGKHLAFFSPWLYPSPMSSPERRDNFVIILSSEKGDSQRLKIPTRFFYCQWLFDGSGLGFVGLGEDKNRYFHSLELATGTFKTRPIPSAKNSSETSAGTASDEGKFLFYFNQPRPGEDGSEPGIYVLDPKSGRKTSILKSKEGENIPASMLRVSRDNKRLVGGMGGNIALIDIDTGHVEKLEYQNERLRAPSWAPEGKHLITGGRSGEGNNVNELFIVSLADGQVKSLNISQYMSPKAQIWLAPDWSPDGRKIAFGTRATKFETNLIRNVIPDK